MTVNQLPASAPAAVLGAARDAFLARDIAHFSPPGHKRNVALDPAGALAHDLTLLGGLEDLQLSRGLLRRAEAAAARVWAADFTRFTTQGTTHLNLALALAVTEPGEPVVVARSSHRSVVAGLALSGAVPEWVIPAALAPLDAAAAVTAEEVTAALSRVGRATAVWLADPTYAGVLAELEPIAAAAHAHGIPLVCDQAWGAHFGLHPDLPPAASRRGVDVSTVSTHKTLSAFTQGAMLHAIDGGRVDLERLDGALDLLTTTSRSGMILASLDEARRLMEARGESLLEHALALARRLRAGIDELPGVRCLDADLRAAGRACDPLRIIVDLSATGVSGYAVEAHLRRHDVHVQMADAVQLIPLLALGDREQHVDRLVDALGDALSALPRTGPVAHSSGAWRAQPLQVATPREASLARHERIPAARAAGRIAAEIVAPYPPGVPALAPGERITTEVLDALRAGVAAGGRISGPTDPSLATMVVVG